MNDLLNEHGIAAWNLAQSMTLQTTLLVLGLIVFDLLVGRHLRSALRYGLWMLVVLKFLMPPSLALPTGAGFWIGHWLSDPVQEESAPYTWTFKDVEATLDTIGYSIAPEPAQEPSTGLTLKTKLLLMWSTGSILIAAGLMLRNRQVRQLVRAADRAPAEFTEALHQAAKSLGLRQPPELRLSKAHHSPAVCGCMRPVILLPKALAEELAPDKLQTVLLHELTHLRRRDLWAHLAQSLVCIIWWWNPIVWMLNRHIRFLRERAVDESMMSIMQDDPTAYPSTLLEVARRCSAQPMLALSFLGIIESRRSLRFRLTRLLQAPLPRQPRLGWSGWAVLGLSALCALPMGFPRAMKAALPSELDSSLVEGNDSSAQVLIQTMFVEISSAESQTFGLEWLIGTTPATNRGRATSTTEHGQPPPHAGLPAEGVFPQIGAPENDTTTSSFPNLLGILTRDQFLTIQELLKSRAGANVLSAPGVITVSGRQAQVTVARGPLMVDSEGVVHAEDLGLSVDLIPVVSEDRSSIDMITLVRYREWVDPEADGSTPSRIRGVPPMDGHAILWDGQTIVLSAEIAEFPDSDESSADLNHRETQRTGKRLWVFVTPTVWY